MAYKNPWDLRAQQEEEQLAATGAKAGQRGQQALDTYEQQNASFDPTAAYNTYMEGAGSQLGKTLDTRLATLKGAAVGQGRLDTGFYDTDVGTVARQTASDFGDVAKSAALTTAGMRQNQIAQYGNYGVGQQELGMETQASMADREQARSNAEEERKARKRSGIGSAIGGVLGGAGGFLLSGGNPYFGLQGFAAGSKVGSAF